MRSGGRGSIASRRYFRQCTSSLTDSEEGITPREFPPYSGVPTKEARLSKGVEGL